jgi:hypothetical protein
VDYATHTADLAWSMTCTCGSPHCRRVVTNEDWRRPDVQERYADHFSPFLNRRIAAGGVYPPGPLRRVCVSMCATTPCMGPMLILNSPFSTG